MNCTYRKVLKYQKGELTVSDKIVYTKIAMVANKVTLRAAERSTNAKLAELEDKGYRIESIQTSAHPVPDEENPNTLRLLWLSLITYKVEEDRTKPLNEFISREKVVIIDDE